MIKVFIHNHLKMHTYMHVFDNQQIFAFKEIINTKLCQLYCYLKLSSGKIILFPHLLHLAQVMVSLNNVLSISVKKGYILLRRWWFPAMIGGRNAEQDLYNKNCILIYRKILAIEIDAIFSEYYRHYFIKA